MRTPFYFLLLFLFFSCVKFKKADLVIHNAKIYTVNESFDIAQAMAIKDGKIIAIGKEHEIMNKFRADEFFDAQTQPIYPGFIDAHSHFIGYGLNKLGVDLSSFSSLDEITAALTSFYQKNINHKWVIGYGWDENKWENKTISNDLLNKEFSNIPVLLWRVDGHSLLVNNKAIELVSTQSTFEKGIVKDKYISQFVERINYTKSQIKQAIRIAQNDCIKNGLTTVTDAGLTNKEINILLKAQENDQLDIRVYAMLKPSEKNFVQFEKEGKIQLDYLDISAFKILIDGSFGSESACLLKPYQGTNKNGDLLITESDLLQYAKRIKKANFQLNAHCIGDSAVRITLATMGKVLKNQNDLRWRIEHAQMVSANDIDLFSKYSIIPSVQPTHGISDMNWAVNKIGEERMSSTYLVKTLLKQNGIIAFGTDFPVEEINPLKTFYSAVARNDKEGNTKDYLLKEKVSREQALKAMTFWAAMANFQENNRGSLEVGKYADFVIMNKDIITIDETKILETEVINTFVGGIEY